MIRAKKIRILVTGASGFIGSRLVDRLSTSSLDPLISNEYEVVCMTRNVESLNRHYNENVKVNKADVMNYQELIKVMSGIDVAFYLIHSMEGSSKDWEKFAEKDRLAAENFATAATECGIKRIIYLGGLSPTIGKEGELSEHLLSRNEVGKILKKSSAKVTIFRAAVILGQGGGSFEMLQYLVERLPIMICPKWVLTRSQPIAVDDVITYLAKSVDIDETEGRTFDIGGSDLLTYMDMMRGYAKMINKSIRILIIPFLTPRLSSYWVDLITPVRASLARPLIDSLKHEAIVTDDSIKKIIPIKLRNFEEAIRAAVKEDRQIQKPRIVRNGRTSRSLNNKFLIIFLLALAAVGSTYYMLNSRPEIFQIRWLVLSGLWYIGIMSSLYFVFKGARLGALTAGIIGWVTLAFWLTDIIYNVSGHSLISNSPNLVMTIRNIIGSVIAAVVVATSHNIFHKIRVREF
ncbi:MAG: NAD-dependent epimerase/dehydratase family protein [Thermoproteota archaeon]|nr:NAD-dependent epimerase/dehydratase family protein [Thermoproteota archaeon]